MDQLFESRVLQEYHKLLDELTKHGGQEQKMHDYFEKRPLLLPGIYGVHEKTNHGVFGSKIFSKFQLNGGIFRRIPDFLFVTKTSIQLQVVFIEIEDPSKKIFTEKDYFNADFNQAYQQLEDWEQWFQHGTNQNVLRDSLNSVINHSMMATLPMKAEYVLVYGRRSEYENMNMRIQRLSQKNKSPFKVMSFDRLACASYTDELITIRLDQNGAHALQVDERYEYDFPNRALHRNIRGKDEAVIRNDFMNKGKKDELVRSIRYLDSLTDKQASKEQMDRTIFGRMKNKD